MKKHLIIIILFLGFLQTTLANDSLSCKVYIYRERSYYSSVVTYKIYANDTLVVRLNNNSYYVYNCKPGRYAFSANKDVDTRVVLNVEAGKTYYLRLGLRTGFWSSQAELLPMDSVFANSKITMGEMKETKVNPRLPYFRPKSRIGLNMNLGGGFESTTMFITSTGGESKISCGGGVALGLKYGYEINRFLDIAVDLNYQFSMLAPYLKNASTTFQRAYVSLTPSFIIPIRGGESMRFKVGGGYDYYFDERLIIEAKKITGGFDDTWKYENVSGYHASLNFEMNFSEKWSMNYGFKYYNVIYKFKPGSNSYPLPSNPLFKPDGSGFDLLIGACYHF